MKRVCFLEGRMGFSGDMLVGALLDAGSPEEPVLEAMEAASGLGRIEISVTEETVGGLRCTDVDVSSEDDEERSLEEIIEYVSGLPLPEGVLETSSAVFRRLGEAEEEVHGETDFHEVGTADAVADVLGAVTAHHRLGLEEGTTLVGPICVGGGETSEGYPVPGPATLNLLRDADLQWHGGPLETELLTPTGAALVAELADASTDFPPSMVTESVGVGAGSKRLERPNVARAITGRSRELSPDQVCLLETAVDDATGEEVAYAVEELMEAGALDVSVLTMGMKKGRTGVLVRVAARPGDAPELSERLYDELGTLGVRQYPVEHRRIASRRVETVELELGGEVEEIQVKLSGDGDVSAEFDDAAELARKHDIPLRRVMNLAEEAAR